MDNLTISDFTKIIERRDGRYDGRFLFGVTTTKIYCRILCPARPKPENIIIFKSHSEAERAGYRPCLRCHPDAAPGSTVLNGTSNTVGRALRLIEQSSDEALDVETLAHKLGVTDRHLRRLFEEHLGASPIEIIITKRLHLAKRLVAETSKPLAEIAFAVGFQSIRRFNDAFKNLFDQTPSMLRNRVSTSRRSDSRLVEAEALQLTIIVRPPYDWTTVLAYLARHEAYGIEKTEGDTYTRFVPVASARQTYGVVSVSPAYRKLKGKREFNALSVRLTGIPLTQIRTVLSSLRNLFDTEHNPLHLPATGKLKSKGVRVPGAFDGFETAVSVILSQLVSTVQAKRSLKQVIVRWGQRLASNGENEIYAFPTPGTLRTARFEELGLTATKSGAIRALAAAVDDGHILLTSDADIEAVRSSLLEIRGIGPWTAELIAMRCLLDPNAFPKNDLIIQRALEAGIVDEKDWSSSRAYLTHCLWRDFASTLTKKNVTSAKRIKKS